MSYEFSEPVIGERVKNIMKKKINYTKGEIGEIEIVKDSYLLRLN